MKKTLKRLLVDLKENGTLKEALDSTLCRTRFERDCGPVVRHTTEQMKYWPVKMF